MRDQLNAGTENTLAMSEFACSADKKKIDEKVKKIQELSRKFIKLVKQRKNIEIINPQNIKGVLSGIFEIVVKDQENKGDYFSKNKI